MKQTNYSFSASSSAVGYDVGLRSYMLYVYNYMFGALLLTGLVSVFTYSNNLISLLYNAGGQMTGLGMIVTFAPIGIALAFGFAFHKMRLYTVQILFWTYATLIGLSLSTLLQAYTGESVARVFFITASVFGAMSIYGYSTKKDLTSFGSYLIMALIGMIFASIINSFMHSTGLQNVLSFVTVLIFVGLTAYDTQKIKNFYYQANNMDPETAKKFAIMGSFSLYLDFINIFVYLMRFFGVRRSD
jgi:FtsH-binding integral membrane protein